VTNVFSPRLGRLIVVFSLLAAAARAQAPIEYIDVANDGSLGDQGGYVDAGAVASVDGRYVVFTSLSNNLSPLADGSWQQVYVRDRVAGTTTLLSVNAAGVAGNSHSYAAVITPSGRFVAFWSDATNLVANDDNNAYDVFLVDRDPDGNGVFDEGNDTLELESVALSGGPGNSSSDRPSISDDGSRVAFLSFASDLVESDTNGHWDAFVRDRAKGVTLLVSVADDETQGNQDTYDPCRISGDGSTVAFASDARNLVTTPVFWRSCFVREIDAGHTELVSVNGAGAPATDISHDPSISTDGRLVAFVSQARNLDPLDTRDAPDVFVRDRSLGTTTLQSIDTDGSATNGIINAFMSADGSHIVFDSGLADVVPNDFNFKNDAFVRNVAAQTTICASVNCMGIPAGGINTGVSYSAVGLSPDGRFAVFADDSVDLASGDNSNLVDVFLNDLSNPGDLAQWSNWGDGWPGTNGVPTLTASEAPAFGTSGSVEIGNSLGIWTVAFLVIGGDQADIPTNDGGTLLVAFGDIVPVLVPPFGGSSGFSIPFDPSLCGATGYLQAIELDAGASHGLSFSPGLSMHVGR
jgi:Tol biopolymer transport system component